MQKNEKSRKWLLNIVIIPLLLGIIGSIVQFMLPKVFEKKEISYSIEKSIDLLEANKELKLEIGDKPITSLYSYRIQIWNSGSLPIKDIPVCFKFNTNSNNFKIFGVKHLILDPGEVREANQGICSKKFIYSLLNPAEKDTAIFWVNQQAGFNLSARAEGVLVREIRLPETQLREPLSLRQMKSYEGLLYGILGAFLLEVADFFSLRSSKSKRYWLISCVLIILGGASTATLAVLKIPLNPLLALSLGAIFPLIRIIQNRHCLDTKKKAEKPINDASDALVELTRAIFSGMLPHELVLLTVDLCKLQDMNLSDLQRHDAQIEIENLVQEKIMKLRDTQLVKI